MSKLNAIISAYEKNQKGDAQLSTIRVLNAIFKARTMSKGKATKAKIAMKLEPEKTLA